MGKRAASLGQLAVHAQVIPGDQCSRLRSVVRAHTQAGIAVSMGRLLIKGGLTSKALRALLRTGVDLDGVRCDGCDLVTPMAEFPERKEYPCAGCGALLLGYAPFRRSKPKPEPKPLINETGRFEEVLQIPSRTHLTVPTPGSGDTEGTTHGFDNPDGSTVAFDEILPAGDAPNLDYIYVFPSGTGRVLSEDETLMALQHLERDSADERDPAPRLRTPAPQRNDELQDIDEHEVSLHDHMAKRELAGFTLLEQLGKGAVGRVFLARQRATQRLVALKVLRTDALQSNELVQRFEREARIASLVAHPNVVEVVDHGVDPVHGVRYLALEYLEGGSLHDLLKAKNQLSERRALEITRGVCMALQAATAHGIIHRDIKPENVLFGSDGVPKLADLGLAKILEGRTQITETGFVVGTPCYIAPEQAQGEDDVDVRADLFSLGFCAWQMLTGVVPFSDRDDVQVVDVILRHMEEDLPDARLYTPTVSPGTAQILKGMTVRDRDQRYAIPAQVVRDIDLVLAGSEPLGPGTSTLPSDLQEVVNTLRESASASGLRLAPTVETAAPVAQRSRPPRKPKAASPGVGCWILAALGSIGVVALGVWVGLWLHYLWRTGQLGG